MGQRCTKRWITEEDIQISKQIESSYSVRKENPCSFTCISAGINPYVERDPEHIYIWSSLHLKDDTFRDIF